MEDLSNIIRFYRDCYQFDLKGIRIRNFLSKQCEKRFIPENNEFYQRHYDGIPVPTAWAKEVESVLFLHAKEKSLYGGSIFIKGYQNNIGKKQVAYVPLYIHELKLSFEHEVFFISIVDSFINPDFIPLANSMDESLDLNADFLNQHLPSNPIGFDNLTLIQAFFASHFPKWQAKDMSHFHDERFNFSNYLQKIKRATTGTLEFFSGLMIGIFRKPQGSIGILNELSQLVDLQKRSKLIELFFKCKNFEKAELKARKIYIPTSLSKPQEEAFFKADAHPISLIIGPPGTGKSFTISALALDAICNNKSVLVVSRNRQACQVISKKIENDFKIKGAIIKADSQVYKRSLISKLNKIVDKNLKLGQNPLEIANRIDRLDRKIEKIQEQIENTEKEELFWGQFYAEFQDGFFAKLKDKWIQYRKRNTVPIWKLNETLIQQQREKIRLVKKYIVLNNNRDLNLLLRQKRKHFVQLIHALREKNSSLLEEKFSQIDFELILQALPLWTSTMKNISRNLPFEQELFDIVIVDEASQCDVASMIPILHRAKKLIVVGDPHQLRHVTFLSDEKQKSLMTKYDIQKRIPDYRRESLIDWINDLLESQDQISFLDEHFRSKTDIIGFSNEKFYGNALKIIRSNPISDRISSIEIVKTEGTRNTKGVNAIEAEKIMDYVAEIMADLEAVDGSVVPSIGIISPFSQQVNFIKSQITKQFTLDFIKKHRILIGTPHHFQGEERDIVLISFALDDQAHFGTIQYLNKPDVFNVLITRARNRQILFTSFGAQNLPSGALLKEYLEQKLTTTDLSSSNPTYDQFYREVEAFLKQSGYDQLHQSMVVSGVQIDLVVMHRDRYSCIDLVGFPGEFEEQSSLQSVHMLNRMNTPIFFIPYSSWCLDIHKTQRDMLHFIENNQA